MKTKSAVQLLILAGFLFFIAACKDDQTNVEKYYEGNWAITSTDEELDTTVTFFIDSEGQFEYSVIYGGGEVFIVGEVNDEGQFTSDLNVNENTIGSVNGVLEQKGTGYGKYTIVASQFDWTAKKK